MPFKCNLQRYTEAIPAYDPRAPFDFEPEAAEGLERASALAEVLPEHTHAAVATLRKRGWTVGRVGYHSSPRYFGSQNTNS